MYQSGRAGDEAKKRKSPAKSGRVGIYGTHSVIGQLSSLFSCVRPACGLSHLNIRMFDIC